MNHDATEPMLYSDIARCWVKSWQFVQWIDAGIPPHSNIFAIFRTNNGLCHFHESRIDASMKQAIADEIEKRNAQTVVEHAQQIAEEQNRAIQQNLL